MVRPTGRVTALRTRVWLPVLAAAPWIAPPSAAGDSMRCGSRLVSVEARAAELLTACGEPAYRDVWSLQPLVDGALAEHEEWTYNFGSQQLLRTIRLRNGRVIDIASDGYGFAERPPEQRRCAAESLVEGLSKYRLLMQCGAPLTRRAQPVLVQQRLPAPSAGTSAFRTVLLPVFREEWVYDFGPNLFMRVLTLDNGRVVQVDNGARGSRQ